LRRAEEPSEQWRFNTTEIERKRRHADGCAFDRNGSREAIERGLARGVGEESRKWIA